MLAAGSITVSSNCLPSSVTLGTTVSFNVTGTASSAISQGAKFNAYGIVLGQKVPFPGLNTDACATAMSCPVAAGGTVNFDETIGIDASWPSFPRIEVEFELEDQNGGVAFCLYGSIALVKPSDDADSASLPPAERGEPIIEAYEDGRVPVAFRK